MLNNYEARHAKASAICQEIIGAAIQVHRALGPGLLESAYRDCLCHELSLRDVQYEREKPLPLHYKGALVSCGYRLDIVVQEFVVVEIKSVRALERIHEAQVITYLKLTRLPVGLLLNFNSAVLRDGIRRFVQDL